MNFTCCERKCTVHSFRVSKLTGWQWVCVKSRSERREERATGRSNREGHTVKGDWDWEPLTNAREAKSDGIGVHPSADPNTHFAFTSLLPNFLLNHLHLIFIYQCSSLPEC